MKNQLNEQEIKISSMGSIAEASLQIGGVFQSAQKAADIYLASARKYAEEIEDAARAKAEEIIDQAYVQAMRIKGKG